MSDLIPIINTKILNNKYDVFWKDITPLIINYQPKPVLIITHALLQGGVEEIQLKKMFETEAACNLTPVKYNLLQIENVSLIPWHQLRDVLQPRIVFLFGVNPTQLGVSARLILNNFNKFGGCIWVPAFSITQFENDRDAKKEFWEKTLRPIFKEFIFGKF